MRGARTPLGHAGLVVSGIYILSLWDIQLTFDWYAFMFSKGYQQSGKVARIPMVLVFFKWNVK